MCSQNLNTLFFFIFSTSLILAFTNSKADDNARASNVTVTSLQAVVDQQVVLTQSLQAELQAEKNRAAAAEASLLSQLTASQNEIITLLGRVAALSTPVAFTVRFSTYDDINTTHTPLRFDKILLNAGNGYDPQTGMFTAPLAGTYAFFLNQMTANRHGEVLMAIVKQSAIVDSVFSAEYEEQASTLVTSHLGRGEQVSVVHQGGVAIRGSWSTIFTGCLLHAD
ncbi:complement C1q-like protein 3 [Littorina saxatilis]|uniref:C1q domain-containing protein n=1 Tax=Littorina saxatilis TaxID=31220 RepID=A0AAN9G3Y3_9CAEN